MEIEKNYYFSKEQIKQARQVNLGEFVISFLGEELERNGNRYRDKKNSSLVFTQNSYYWNSQNEHGNSIDFLVRHRKMTPSEAIEILLEYSGVNKPLINVNKQVNELDFEIEPNMARAIAYLNKTRMIDYSIIKMLIRQKLLFQEKKTNNIIFPIYDNLNCLVGAELTGTLTDRDKRFKGVKTGSKYGFGYSFKDDLNTEYILFFESAIDLISFYELKKLIDKKSLKNCMLVSMAGLKENIIEKTREIYPSYKEIFLCVDNDEAGRNFKNENKNFKELSPNKIFKDWNEQLIDIKKAL